ncbi:MAG: IS630 family transposase [Thiotrichaceae bacterium IS1]|nr:MAG: IS630 family transposase [Thiotrichaceae bacterium IS1]
MTIKLSFTQADIEALQLERYNHPHPRVQRKMEALWLKSQGLSHQPTAKLTGITENTLREYFRQFQQGGIEALKELKFRQPVSQLAEHQITLEEHFRSHPCASLKQACAQIEALTGIKRHPTNVRKFMIQLGMTYQKVGAIPAKACLQTQEDFKKNELLPRLEQAKQRQREVFWVDAAHFVLGSWLGYFWSFVRLFIKAPAGRQRFNVLAALNAITYQLITVTNNDYINAQSVCTLLQKLASSERGLPITLVLDNARYQKCRLVMELANSLGIELLFLPPYSPNLNLVERFWKFVKRKCLYGKYYDNFSSFTNAITDCLSKTHTTYKQELETLLTFNFQNFSKANIVTL